jgi:HEAT repeat protein
MLKPKIDVQPIAVLQSTETGLLQRSCACGNHTIAGSECATCRGQGPSVSAIVHPSLMSHTSAFTGSAFGHDLSGVPLHSETPAGIQTKLTISTPGDIHEQEADAVADKLMGTHDDVSSSSKHPTTPALPASFAQRVQLKSNGGVPLNSALSTEVTSSLSAGSNLDCRTQSFMEGRFGADFSRVRIHNDSKAVQLSRELNAQAFTLGNHVFFDEGKYRPETASGKRLLAHELMHTLQQQGSIIHRQPQQKNLPPPPTSTTAAIQADVNEQIKIIGEPEIPFELWQKNFGPDRVPDDEILFNRKIEAVKRLIELKDPGAVPTLVAVLNDQIFAVRRLPADKKIEVVNLAGEALGKTGGAQALSELTRMLNDADIQKRQIAVRAFKYMKDTGAASAMLARLDIEPDAELKKQIVGGLGEIGQDLRNAQEKTPTVEALIKILSNSKLDAQKAMLFHVMVALGKIGDKRATGPLLEIVHYWRNDESTLITGLQTLGLIGDVEAVNYIDTWLRLGQKPAVRIAAATALGEIGGVKAITKLQNRLEPKQESDAQVIQAIKKAIFLSSGG